MTTLGGGSPPRGVLGVPKAIAETLHLPAARRHQSRRGTSAGAPPSGASRRFIAGQAPAGKTEPSSPNHSVFEGRLEDDVLTRGDDEAAHTDALAVEVQGDDHVAGWNRQTGLTGRRSALAGAGDEADWRLADFEGEVQRLAAFERQPIAKLRRRHSRLTGPCFPGSAVHRISGASVHGYRHADGWDRGGAAVWTSWRDAGGRVVAASAAPRQQRQQRGDGDVASGGRGPRTFDIIPIDLLGASRPTTTFIRVAYAGMCARKNARTEERWPAYANIFTRKYCIFLTFPH